MFTRKLTLQMKLMMLLVVVPLYFLCGSIIVTALLKFAAIELSLTIDSNFATVLLNLILDSLLVVISVFTFKEHLIQQWKDYFKHLKDNLLYSFLIGPLIVYGLGIVGGIITVLLGSDATSANQSLIEELVNNHMILMTFTSVVLAPIFEELLFRGTLFAWLYEFHPLLAHILSGFLFGFIHVMNSVLSGNIAEMIQIFAYFFMGCGLSYIYEKRNNIYVPIFAHATNNFISMIIVILL